MEEKYEGAARRLARALEVSSEATRELTAEPRGRRARQIDPRQLAHELTRVMSTRSGSSGEAEPGDR